VVILSPKNEVLYATKDGELADARKLGDDGIYDFFQAGDGGGDGQEMKRLGKTAAGAGPAFESWRENSEMEIDEQVEQDLLLFAGPLH